MQVTVKDIKVKEGEVKSGPKIGQHWKLIILIGEDGTEFTTFDAGAQDVGIGGIIQLEPIIKAGKINFTEFKIIQKGTASVVAGNGNGKSERPGMSPDAWAEKDRLERWSRECNTCFMGIMEVVDKGLGGAYSEKFGKVFDAALDWAVAHFTNKPATQPVTKPPAPATQADDTPPVEPGTFTFNNLGEFYSACLKVFSLTKSAVDKEITGIDLKTEEGRKEAFQQLNAVFGVKPNETDTTKKEEGIDPEDIPF